MFHNGGNKKKLNDSLYLEIQHKDINKIKELLAQGADPNYIKKKSRW